MGPLLSAGIMLGLKGLDSLFGGKAKEAQYDENRDATIAGLGLKQKMSEDRRRAILALANSLMNRIPETTAGGGVRTNIGLDPAIFEMLNKERSYDFASAVPESKGGVSGFLSGLFGGAAETVPYLNSPLSQPGQPGAVPQPAAGAANIPSGDLTAPNISLDELLYMNGEDD